MTQSVFSVKILIDGEAAEGLSVLLSDPTGGYGVKRNDTGAAVVADGTAMTEIGGGVYRHVFTDPAEGLTYTGWVEYTYDGEVYRFSEVFDAVAAAGDETAGGGDGSPWEGVICYADRAEQYSTSAWRLSGVSTRAATANTDDGLLWLSLGRDGDTLTAALYADSGLDPARRVAAGTADLAPLADGGSGVAPFIEVSLAADAGGVSAAFRLHAYKADGACPVLAALCTDADLELRWQGASDLDACDAFYGLSACIRDAGAEVLQRAAALYPDALAPAGGSWWAGDPGGAPAGLEQIRNPRALRPACAERALALALGREHQHAGGSAYAELRDHFNASFARRVETLALSLAADRRAAPRRVNRHNLRLSRA